MSYRTFGAVVLVCALAGCTVGPDYARPQTQAPQSWAEPLEGGLTVETTDLRQWWHGFNDPMLDSLVDRALVGSLDLRQAAARVREARALRGVTAADQLPNVDVGGSASYSRTSENTDFADNAPGTESDVYDAGFDATWELDVFGRVRRAVEAADADIESALESERDVRVTLLSEIARNYVEVRSFQARLAIAQKNVQTQQETLDLSRARLEAGLSPDLEVAQAEAQVESSRAQLPELATALKQAAFRLDVLLGLQPGTLLAELESAQPVPAAPEAADVGLPAELLRRRPDIRRAERDLAAASARVGVATAELYPRFTLSGNFGFESSEIGNLFDGDSRTWGIGPLSVRWPLFDGGRIRSNIRVQEARQEQTLVEYERTVLSAYEEVANAMVRYARIRERHASLTRAEQASQRAFELANDLWSRGLTDFLNVLDTQRALFLIQDQRAAAAAALSTSLIALYKALGGGWDYQAESVQALGEAEG
jgi:NodT family efflux transporter outer membrane factor (OMF) lipoprotein